MFFMALTQMHSANSLFDKDQLSLRKFTNGLKETIKEEQRDGGHWLWKQKAVHIYICAHKYIVKYIAC